MTTFDFDIVRVDNLRHSFADKSSFDVVVDVFSQYPPELVNSMDIDEINDVIVRLNQREDVRRLQDSIAQEVKGYGQKGLEHIAAMMSNHLPVNQGPKRSSLNVERKNYDEIQAICNNCNEVVASGNFERRQQDPSLENVVFRPDNIFYASDLQELFIGNRLVHPKCGGTDQTYSKKGQLSIYRDKPASFQEKEARAKKIIQDTGDDSVENKNHRYRYSAMEAHLIGGLGRVFSLSPDASKPYSGSIDYSKLYDVFEWIFRENINLDQFKFSRPLKNSLMKSIGNNMLPIHGIISSRLKSLERIFEKGLEVLYNIHNPEDRVIKDRRLEDVYGVKVMVNTEKDCYIVANSIKAMNGFLLSDEHDSIKAPRYRGEGPPYMSYDLKISDGCVTYEIQIRTHKMDRIIRTSPNLIHSFEYLEKKRSRLEQIPMQTRAVFATLIGLPSLNGYGYR